MDLLECRASLATLALRHCAFSWTVGNWPLRNRALWNEGLQIELHPIGELADLQKPCQTRKRLQPGASLRVGYRIGPLGICTPVLNPLGDELYSKFLLFGSCIAAIVAG